MTQKLPPLAGDSGLSPDSTLRDNQQDPLDRKYGEILGLQGSLGPGDVRKQYLKLTKQYHPDTVRHLGPKLRDLVDAEMKQINEAYEYFTNKYGPEV